MKTDTIRIGFGEPLLEGTFVKREKRFLAHVLLGDGSAAIAHCPNTGSMKTNLISGAPVILWDSQNAKRKYRLGWKAIKVKGHWIGVDTSLPNRLTQLAIEKGLIEPLAGYDRVERERPMGKSSRVDLLLTGGGPDCYVEVKNVTLVEEGVARFPDAVTARGLKHLHELVERVEEGSRAAMVYVVQRGDGNLFRPADDIDPGYGEGLRWASGKGVEIFALSAVVDEAGVSARGLIPIEL